MFSLSGEQAEQVGGYVRRVYFELKKKRVKLKLKLSFFFFGYFPVHEQYAFCWTYSKFISRMFLFGFVFG